MNDALINKTVVTLYGRPQLDPLQGGSGISTIQDEGLYGMPVEIIERKSREWVKIRTHYQYEGYVQIKDLWLMSTQEKVKRTNENLKFVLQSYVDVLAVPKVQGICLQSLTRGAIVKVIEAANVPGGWVKIGLNNGQEGYVKERFLGTYYEDNPSSTKEEVLRQNIVNSAQAYLGTQYRWGGKSTLGIDCSGLCSMAYLLNGIKIFRDAKIKDGFPIHKIQFEDKKPGDLIFYEGHVTLYMGEDLYIHSTAHHGSDGVVINSFNPTHQNYRRDLAENIRAVGSIF